MAKEISELCRRYRQLSAPLVYDVLDQMGYPHQALSAEIRPLAPGMVAIGPAFTVEGRDRELASLPSVSLYQLFRDLTPHAVIVLATCGHRTSGPWGENTSISAQLRGCHGLVTDGGVRDASALIAMGFPTFCRFVTPVYSQGRFAITGYQIPVVLPGQLSETVTIHPGDFILADQDGIVVVPARLAEDVLLAAEELRTIEERIRAALRSGEDREQVYRRYPKFDHIQRHTQHEGG